MFILPWGLTDGNLISVRISMAGRQVIKSSSQSLASRDTANLSVSSTMLPTNDAFIPMNFTDKSISWSIPAEDNSYKHIACEIS